MRETHAIKFGTDGWRAVIGDTYTFANVKLLSQAVADYLGAGRTAAVGFDTRFLSDKFAHAAAQILSNNGITVILADRAIPTPALSFTVKQRTLDMGVMITASHNPAEYNGYKLKTPSGGAAAGEMTAKVESLIGRNPVKDDASGAHLLSVDNFSEDYVKFIRSYIDFKRIRTKKFKVCVDAMYGAGNSFIADVLRGSNIRLEFMRNTVNPSFGGIHPEPVEELLKGLMRRVKEGSFDLGIALDGDADRIAAVAPGGIFIHPQKILGLLALHLNQDRRWSGGIVKTICGSAMVDRIARFLGVELYETPVGFKYISELMETKDIITGGEEAGGMGVKNYIPERDGTMAGLLLLEMMVYRNKDMREILNGMEKQFGRYYYLRDALKIVKPFELKKEQYPSELLGRRVIETRDSDGLKFICDDESWLMMRSSGTEPIIRLYVESKRLRQSRKLLELGKEMVIAQQ